MQNTTQKRLAGKKKFMDVHLNPGRGANLGAGQPVVRRGTVPPANGTLSGEPAQALERTMKSAPRVRPEKVAQAAALAADASYPTDAQLRRLAGFLAPQLGGQER